MKTIKKTIFTISLVVMCASLFAQKGKISGLIIDKSTQETLIGVNVSIDSSTLGATSDMDGKYEIADLEPGKYTIVFSYIGYADKKISNVDVKADAVTELNVNLEIGSKELSEVEIVDFKKTNTETAVLLEMKNSNQIASGVSSQQITKTADKDAAQVVKRIPGVTVQGNYINIRGLNQRYNNVLLHNVIAPSVETDIKSFAFDIIPSAQLDRIIVLKSPSAEVTGDFAGGIVKIYTKSLPDSNYVSVSYNTTFRVGTSFKPFYAQKSGALFYLGYDTKNKLPNNFPKDISDVAKADIENVAEQLNNNWTAKKMAAIPDQSIGLTFANRFSKNKALIGVITAINYNLSKQTNAIQRNDYNQFDFINNKPDAIYSYTDMQYTNTTRIGVLHNWAFKIGSKHLIEFKNLFNTNSSTIYTNRIGDNFANGFKVNNYALYNVNKGVFATQVMSKHNINSDINTIDWVVGYSRAYKNEPDFKRYTTSYNETTKKYEIYVDPSAVNATQLGRFYADLNENMYTAGVNSINKFGYNVKRKVVATVSVGTNFEYKNRDFSARNIGYKRSKVDDFDFNIIQNGIENLMTNENINNTTGIKIGEQTRENDSYKANTILSGTYANAEINIKQQLRIVAGFRFEYFQQNLATPLGTTKVQNTKLSYLPSVNISYNITPKIVIRGAYGMSVNRPEFREIAPFAFDDFYTGYAIIGNTELKNCSIHNTDVKFEYYPTNSEIISASFFYKKFINPIESKAIIGAAREFTFVNAASANVYGVEVEIKKNFAGSKNSFFQHFGVMANATYVYSKINLGKEAVGQSNNRPLQGQAPYSINSGMFYENKDLGLQVNLLYNVVGKRIVYVGTDDYPDIYEMPRHTLDFNAAYKFKKGIELNLSLKDLVNQDVLLIQDGNGDKKWNKKTDQIFQKYKPGQTISVGVKYTF